MRDWAVVVVKWSAFYSDNPGSNRVPEPIKKLNLGVTLPYTIFKRSGWLRKIFQPIIMLKTSIEKIYAGNFLYILSGLVDVKSLCSVICLKRTKINEIEAGDGPPVKV